MAQKVVIWFGPVSYNQVKRATLLDSDVFIVMGGGCTPNIPDAEKPKCQGSSYFSNMIEKYFDGQRYLPKLLRSKGVDPSSAELYIGSFSAGHGAVKKLCMHPDDRALIQVVSLSDSTYCSWPNKVPQASEGYVRMAVDAVSHPKLFVASASGSVDPAGKTPPGNACMLAIKNEVEKRAGMRFSESGYWPGTDPVPNKVYQLGNCILADFGSQITHPQHATLMAPQVWPQLVATWLNKPQECMAAAIIPQAAQGFGQDVAEGCSMWGRLPPGVSAELCVAKEPRIIIDEGPAWTATKLIWLGAGAVGAYALLRWAQRKTGAIA